MTVAVFTFLFLASTSSSVGLLNHSKSTRSYEVIHPRQYEHTNTGELTKSVRFDAFNRTFDIELQKNDILISPHFHVVFQTKDRAPEIQNDVENCHYQGRLTDDSNSSVTLTTCDGLRGIIKDGSGQEFIIEPSPTNISADGPALHRTQAHTNMHVIYRRQDILMEKKATHQCGTLVNEQASEESSDRKNTENVWHNEKVSSSIKRRGVNILENKIEEDEEDKKKYIETFVVVDNILYKKYGRKGVVARVVRLMNMVDSLYKKLNTRVVVVEVRVWDKKDKILINDYAFSNFKKYVYETLFGKENIKADVVVLLMGYDFTGALYGVAGIGTMCTASAAAVIQDYSRTDEPGVANTIAHEMGHTLGFYHSDNCKCSGTCVMNSLTATGYLATAWSDCSRKKYKKGLTNGALTCLYDYPDKHFGDSKCGNGILEKGEECDCGSEPECLKSRQDKCCNQKTCTLHTNATCSDGPCCETCQPKSKGFQCRRSYDSECDLPEFCTGSSTQCPANFYVQDGTPCDGENGVCYRGSCKSHNYQCQTLWGPTAHKAHPQCFGVNTWTEDSYANCGTVKENGKETYIPCAKKDIYCGKLQCTGNNLKRPLIGRPGIYVKDVFFTGIPKCSMCYIPTKKDEDDPSMAMAGTKCGENSMCDSDRKCVNISTMSWIKNCSAKCLNGGVCNNNGNCHCTSKYACPNCEKPGFGGSVDSGQGCEVDSSLSATVVVLLVLLLGVFVGVGLLVWKRKEIRTRLVAYRIKRKAEVKSDTTAEERPASTEVLMTSDNVITVAVVDKAGSNSQPGIHYNPRKRDLPDQKPPPRPPVKPTKRPPPPPQKRQVPTAPPLSQIPHGDSAKC